MRGSLKKMIQEHALVQTACSDALKRAGWAEIGWYSLFNMDTAMLAGVSVIQ